jgi:hypothetical protein
LHYRSFSNPFDHRRLSSSRQARANDDKIPADFRGPDARSPAAAVKGSFGISKFSLPLLARVARKYGFTTW